MSIKTYYPEMKEEKPAAHIEASLGHYGKHYYLRTPLTLETNRSVKFMETFERNGETWNRYKVTVKAFDAICEKYAVSYQMLLS